MSADREHWEGIYAEDPTDSVSWFEAVPRSSLAMIEDLGLSLDEPIVDVGGGSSRLAAELLNRGHSEITVLDISGKALERARQGLHEADRITWVAGDVRNADLERGFALWHDRAAFHFMVSDQDRRAYLAALERGLKPGGSLIMATFGPAGPSHCSGLQVARYSPDALAATIGDLAELASSHYEEHRTPSGATQQFLFAHFVRPASGS